MSLGDLLCGLWELLLRNLEALDLGGFFIENWGISLLGGGSDDLLVSSEVFADLSIDHRGLGIGDSELVLVITFIDWCFGARFSKSLVVFIFFWRVIFVFFGIFSDLVLVIVDIFLVRIGRIILILKVVFFKYHGTAFGLVFLSGFFDLLLILKLLLLLLLLLKEKLLLLDKLLVLLLLLSSFEFFEFFSFFFEISVNLFIELLLVLFK